MLTKKSKMISEDTANFLYNCGVVWKNSISKTITVVVTEHKVDAQSLFREYYHVIKSGIDSGVIILKTLSEVTLDDLNSKIIIEY